MRTTPNQPRVYLLYAGFLFLGAMTVLLGVLLPRISAEHGLHDAEAGTVLLVQFLASSLGALAVGKRPRRQILRGYLLLAAGLLAVPLLHGIWLLTAVALFTFGLGLAMTATSIYVGSVFRDERGAALSQLNFCWSLGALLCPLATSRVPDAVPLATLALPLAILSILCATIPIALPQTEVSTHPTNATFAPRLAIFAVLSFLYVGAESAVGGWMTTYALRIASWRAGDGSMAAAVFWGALLAGRGIAPLLLKRIPELPLARIAVLVALSGLALLYIAHGPWILMAGCAVTGFALGPVFPLVIALMLERAGNKRTGWVFAVSGFGGAVLPWLAGVIAGVAGSLRMGLMVAFLAMLGMFCCSLMLRSVRNFS